MIEHLFRVPEAFWNPVLYERFGAIIKDRATGRIVAHLQEVSPWRYTAGLPLPGGNPLQLAAEATQMAQLAGIQQTLNTVQTLATVGAVASVASLGVSVAGFSVVIAKLARMDRKLDRLLSETERVRRSIERLDLKLDALPLARLGAELEAIGLAQGYGPARQRDTLQRAVSEISVLRHYYYALLADKSLYSMGTAALPAVLDVHERLVACCQGELFAELMIAEDPAHVSARCNHHLEQLSTIGWRTGKDLYDLVEEGDRAARVYSVISPVERREKVSTLVEIRGESMARLASTPEVAQRIRHAGLSPSEYLKAVTEWTGDQPVVAVIAGSTDSA